MSDAHSPSGEGNEMQRIGRPATAKEAGLQLVLENADVLERVSRNLYADRTRCSGLEADRQWDAMGDNERASWREEAIALLREHAAAPDPRTPDDDPDPGCGLPIEAVA